MLKPIAIATAIAGTLDILAAFILVGIPIALVATRYPRSRGPAR